jgi:hypothetical protein
MGHVCTLLVHVHGRVQFTYPSQAEGWEWPEPLVHHVRVFAPCSRRACPDIGPGQRRDEISTSPGSEP